MGASKFKAIGGALFGAIAVATAGAAEAPSPPAPIFGEMRAPPAEAPKPSPECLSLREMAKEGMIVDDDAVLSGGEIELRLALSAPPAMAPNAAAAGMWIACLLAQSEDHRWPTSVSMQASYREGCSAMRDAPEEGILSKAAEAMAFVHGSSAASAQKELRACFKKASINRKKFKNSKISLGNSGPGGELGISCSAKRERGEGLIFDAETSAPAGPGQSSGALAQSPAMARELLTRLIGLEMGDA